MVEESRHIKRSETYTLNTHIDIDIGIEGIEDIYIDRDIDRELNTRIYIERDIDRDIDRDT